jgi:hypothetical protein
MLSLGTPANLNASQAQALKRMGANPKQEKALRFVCVLLASARHRVLK